MPEIKLKTFKFYSPSMLDTGDDKLLYVLGSSWELMSQPSSYIEGALEYDWIQPHVSTETDSGFIDDLAGSSKYRTVTRSDWEPLETDRMIHSWEYNPYNVTMVNPNAYIPNFKIPIRFYANIDNSKGDMFWNIYWNGGMWNDKEYYPLIDQTKSYYNIRGQITMPYFEAPIRFNGFEPSTAFLVEPFAK